jgi:heat-inducible transcriptional repressor
MDLMNDRLRDILNTVILYHIQLGSPIGSRTVTKLSGMGLSPATIRNVMADLEEMGYLTHPHTSAGRVPTEKGYRFYVDALLREEGWFEPPTQKPTEWSRGQERPSGLLQEASRMLSEMSHYAGVVVAPRLAHRVFKQIEFIGLRPHQVLAIFVSEDGLVHQTLFEVERAYSTAELREMAHHLNSRYSGVPLQLVGQRLLEEMQQVKERYDSLLGRALDLGRQAMSTGEAGEIYVEGAANILNQEEFADFEEMKSLFKAFEEKYRLLKVLEQCLDTLGVQVYIGSENAALGTTTCSLVVSTYQCQGRPIGSVGVIGPTRMDYSHVIPLVQETANQLSHYFDERLEGLRQ